MGAPLRRSHWCWLLLATGLGLWLRLQQLGEWSLWVDEAHTWRDATMPLQGEQGFLRQDRALYPLTFLLLRGLLALGWCSGEEASLRLPYALFGALSVPLLALLGRRWCGPTAAVAAAFLCAVHPWHIYWSQNARGYVLAFLFASVALHRAMVWSDSGRNRDLFGCWAALGIGSLCHPTTALLMPGLLAYSFGQRLPGLRLRSLVLLALGLVLALWLLPFAVLWWSPFQGFLAAKDDPSLLHLLQTTAYYYRPVLLLMALVGWYWLFHSGERRPAILLACLGLVPMLLLVALGGSLVKTTARYSLAVLPIVFWLAAVAAVRIGAAVAGTRPRPRLLAAAVAAALAVAVDLLLPLHGYYRERQGDRGGWRQACAAAQAVAGDRGLWVATVGYPIAVYYLQPDLWQVGHDRSAADVHVQALTTWSLLGDQDGKPLHEPGGRAHLRWQRAAAKALGNQFVVIISRPELAEVDDGQLWPTLQEEFDLLLHLPCFVGPKDESLYVFVPRGG